MGSIFAPKAPQINFPQQEPAELLDYIDEVSGVEQRVVTRADGTKEIVRKQRPLSEEEQQFRDQTEQRLKDAFDRITAMTNVVSAMDVPEFKETLNAFETNLRKSVDRSFKVASEAQEEALARRGLSDSTSGVHQRRQQLQQRAEAEQQIDASLRLQAEELRSAEIGRQQNLLGLATGQQQQIFQNQLVGSQFGGGLQTAQLSSQLAFQQAQQQVALANAQAKMQASAIGAQTFGDLLGAAGGYFGGR